MKVYILYIDDERSKKYLAECLESIKKFPNLEPIPVEGYKGIPVMELANELGVDVIPFYQNQLEQNGEVLNRAFSCTAGHMKIWQMIADSREPGVVLEHDAIVKADLSKIPNLNYDITWLGPRVMHADDYQPQSDQFEVLPCKRYEGTHAYAITDSDALCLLNSIKYWGFADSLDGMLGMRNFEILKFGQVSPPMVVAAVGDRESCIETEGNPGFWNAENIPSFLEGLRPGAVIPPVRAVDLEDEALDKAINVFYWDLIDWHDEPKSVLVVGDMYGVATNKIADDTCGHPSSSLVSFSPFVESQAFQLAAYMSRYYYNISCMKDDGRNTALLDTFLDRTTFDLIYLDCHGSAKESIYSVTLCYDLLAKDCNGKLIVKTDNPKVRQYIEHSYGALNIEDIYQIITK